MIPNQWYYILESSEVKPGQVVGVTRMGEKLVLWRDSQGKVICMSDQCPHRGVALSAGRTVDGCIECPFHGFQFDPLGRCTLIPANGRTTEPPRAMQVLTYPTSEKHGLIAIWWGDPQHVRSEPPFYAGIDESFSYSTLRNHWATHYSRAIENQLDVVHLPFVHNTTIGRGNKTLVNGPQWEKLCDEAGNSLINIWVNNVVDQGQQPLKSSQLPPPDRRPLLQFYFPNLWQNWLSDGVRIVAVFAPIDDENTLMYVRMYQKVVRLPGLRQVFDLTSKLGNLVILRQDRRVVITQRPKRSDLRSGEKLIQGDGPIIEYRRIRQQLIDQAAQAFP